MKFSIYNLIVVLTLTFGFSRCTEEIDIDLNKVDSVVVIEGLISTDSDYSTVSITRTKDFSESNTFENIKGAYVELSDNAGHSDILKENSEGKYNSSLITGIQGITYSMKVIVNDTTYTSECKIPLIVKMDSTRAKKEIDDSFFGNDKDTVYNFYVYYSDPAHEDNYYQLLAYKNGEQVFSSVYSDLTNDGLNVEQYFTFKSVNSADDDDDEDEILEKGDFVTIEMRCISEDVYDYFNDLSSSGMVATPTNPQTNISGAKLGYFSAHTSEKKLFKVNF